MNETSPALLYPRTEQLLARLFVALICGDDAAAIREQLVELSEQVVLIH